MQKHGGASAHFSTQALCAENVRSSASSPGLLISSPALGTCSHILSTQDVFAKTKGDENDIYLATVAKIAQAHKRDPELRGIFKENPKNIKDMSLKVVDETDIIIYKDKRLVIPDSMRHQVVQWYHHYLMHPGHT